MKLCHACGKPFPKIVPMAKLDSAVQLLYSTFAPRAMEVHENHYTTKSCVFLQALYLQCVYYCVSMQNKTCQVCTTSSFRVEKYLQQELSTIFKIQN